MRSLLVLALVASCGSLVGAEVGEDGGAQHCASVLPVTRNRTYGAETPVASADMDDIQDAIVGSKHPEWEIPLSGYSFHPSVFNGPSPGGYGVWTGYGSGTAWFVSAGLVLPVGTRITRVQWAYDRNAAAAGGDFITAALYRVPWDHGLPYPETGAEENTVNTYADAATVGPTSVERVINHTTLSGWSYFLQFSVSATLDAHAPLFYGARVFADRL